MILAHHAGEELLVAAMITGAGAGSVAIAIARARLGRFARWLLKR